MATLALCHIHHDINKKMYEHTVSETLLNETRIKTNIGQIDRGGTSRDG